MVFVLLGRGAAGKTETAPFLNKLTGLPVIELGKYIREKAKQGNSSAKRVVTDYINHGRYFSGELSLNFIEKAIAENPLRFKNGFIIDGFPRQVKDLSGFERFLAERGFLIGGALELKVPQTVSNRRQAQRSGRTKTKEVLENRNKEFRENEEKVLAAFRELGLVHTIGMQKRGRAKRFKQKNIPLELERPQFLKQKARLIAKGVKRLRQRKPFIARPK